VKRLFALLLLLATPLVALAQQSDPRVGYIFPAGGKAGTTVRVVFGGQALGGVQQLHISGEGVSAGTLEYTRPPNPGEAGGLRDSMRELMQRRDDARRLGPATRPWTDREEAQLSEIRGKLFAFVNRASIPALQETVTVDLTISPTAAPGPRQLRIITPSGSTVPLRFHVGSLSEVIETESTKVSVRREVEVTLPTVVNGRIMAGDIDRIRFRARKGQRLVAAIAARDLIPYISDAVPGWFQATARLLDSSGNELAFSDDYQCGPDPLIVQTIPADGDYVLEIRDALFRGREDFIYRASIGEFPLITSAFPLGGKVGQPTLVELRGVNLPSSATTRPSITEGGITPLAWALRGTRVGPILFESSDLPEILDRTTNPLAAPRRASTTLPATQPIAIPVIVNGRIAVPGERDCFTFAGKAREEVVVEVTARRLGSPLDALVVLTDEGGAAIASGDDNQDLANGLMTHHADSYLRVILPRDGKYQLTLADLQGHGGIDFAYRLRVSAPIPDFALRAVPSMVCLRGGVPQAITVHAMRRDGFNGAIDLKLAGDASSALLLQGGGIPAGAGSVTLTLTAQTGADGGIRPLLIQGTGHVGDTMITHIAAPADDWQQAFSYRHLVVAEEGLIRVDSRTRSRPAAVLSKVPVQLAAGSRQVVRVDAPFLGWRAMRDPAAIKFQLRDPPAGVELSSARLSGTIVELTMSTDPSKAISDFNGNLIIEVTMERQRRVPLGLLPAIPCQIIPAEKAEQKP
jgi:hypothetical protein